MSIFSYLFQPDKSKLSPAGRAFVAWLEIVIVSIPAVGAGAGLDYLNGHPNDFSGMVPFIISAMVVALLKAFTTLGVSMKNTGVIEGTVTPVQAPTPPAQPPVSSVTVHNTLPEPRVIQVTPAPTPLPEPAPPPVVQQFKAPVLPAPVPIPDQATRSMPVIGQSRPDERDWTGLEMPAVR